MAAVVVVAGAVVLTRFDGLRATDAATGDSTRWFVDRSTRRLALIDGYSGTTLARMHPGTNKQQFEVANGPAGAFLLYQRSSEARIIDESTFELGDATPISQLTATNKVTSVTRRGLTVIDADTGNGSLFDKSAVLTPFGSPQLDQPLMAADGTLWGVDGSELVHVDGADTARTDLDTSDVRLSLAGDNIVVLDAPGHRARFGDGDWVNLPTAALGVDPTEVALQEPSPTTESCGWVAAHDAMWCVGKDGIERTVGLEHWVSVLDRLAINGRAAVIVSSDPSEIVHFDPVSGAVIDSSKASVPPNADLEISATDGMIWIEDVAGQLIWAANQWTLQSARKDDERAPLVGATGDTIDSGEVSSSRSQLGNADELLDRRLPDNNGIDDRPVAVDDHALVRSGSSLPLVATANDYDPDGEAIVIQNATAPAHGSTTIASATTISYQPDPGYEGTDTFEYTIVDGDGDDDTATVTITVVGADHPNSPPIAQPDWSETVAGVPVVIDVLTNDYDPERDPVDISSSFDVGNGSVRTVTGPSGLPAFEFTPDVHVAEETDVTFTYKAADAFGAVSDAVSVTIHVRPVGSENLPPVLEADSVRAPVSRAVLVPVLANDRDPDGDELRIVRVQQVPAGLNVQIKGQQLQITALRGAVGLLSFGYTVEDSNGNTVGSTVLVLVEPEAEVNRPPVAVPDILTSVAGQRTRLNPLKNDYDPDGDEIAIVSVGEFVSDEVPGATVELIDGEVRLTVPPWTSDSPASGSFSYEISDGRGDYVAATVTVKIMPQALDQPPVAVDDVVTTEVGKQVTLNVLANDADPSGQEQTLVGDPVCPQGIEATSLTGGLVRLDPQPGRVGIFRCSYRVANPQGLTSIARIIVTVVDESLVNRPPEPVNDSVSVNPGESVTISPLANDVDPDDDRLVLDRVEQPTRGVLERNGNAVTFTAPENPGIVSFAYQVSDGNGGISTGQITVTVRSEALRPLTANDVSRSLQQPGSGTELVDVLSSVVKSKDGDKIELSSVTKLGGPGSVAVRDRMVLFTYDSTASGTISAAYRVRSSDGQTATANVSLTLISGNRAPVAPTVDVTVTAGESTEINLIDRVSDPDNDPVTLAVLSSNMSGVRANLTNGRVRIGADVGVQGTGTVTYRASDRSTSTNGTIRVTVVEPPKVCPDGVAAPPIELKTPMETPIDVAFNEKITGTVTELPPELANGRYVPPPGFYGVKEFRYTVGNECGEQAVGSVTIQVNLPPNPVNWTGTIATTTRILVESLATDQEKLKIIAVSQTSGKPEAVAWDGAGITLQPAEMGSEPVTLAVTIADPGQLSVKVTVTAHKEPEPDTNEKPRDRTVSLSTTAEFIQLGDGDQLVQSVSLVSSGDFNMTVSLASSGKGADVKLGKDVAGTGTFTYELKDGAGAGTITVTYIPSTTTSIGTGDPDPGDPDPGDPDPGDPDPGDPDPGDPDPGDPDPGDPDPDDPDPGDPDPGDPDPGDPDPDPGDPDPGDPDPGDPDPGDPDPGDPDPGDPDPGDPDPGDPDPGDTTTTIQVIPDKSTTTLQHSG